MATTSKTKTKTKHGGRPTAGSKQVGMTFGEEESAFLERESESTGLPFATLVRFIVRRRYNLSNPLPEQAAEVAK